MKHSPKNAFWILAVGSLALVMAVPPAQAQQQADMTQTGQTPHGKASPADKTFIRKALDGSNAEVKLGQLAAQKASSTDVKQFGQKMVDDHTQLNQQMQPVAQQLGLTASANVPPNDKVLETRLEKLSGSAFDKAYMRAMVMDHRKDLAQFKRESKDAHSAAVKDAAKQGAQVIQQHLQLAEQVAKSVGAVGTNQTNKTGSRSVSTPTGPQ